jgi:hypothetical protein
MNSGAGFTGDIRAPWQSDGGDGAQAQGQADPQGGETGGDALPIDLARAQVALRVPCPACNPEGIDDTYEGGAPCALCNPENAGVEHGYPQGWRHVFVSLPEVLRAYLVPEADEENGEDGEG